MAAPTIVAGQTTTNQAGGSLSTTLPNPTTLGNYIVVWWVMGVVGSTPAASDSQGNTYTTYAQQTAGIGFSFITGFSVALVASAGSTTITFNTYGGNAFLIFTEWTGVTGIEASAPSNAANPGSSIAVGPITTTAANTRILFGGGSYGVATLSNTNGWGSEFSGGGSGGNPSSNLFSFPAGAAGNYGNTMNSSNGGVGLLAGMVGLMGSGIAPGSALIVNPGMDGGMRPQLKGGMNG